LNVVQGVIHFRNTKSGGDRSIPVSSDTAALLREQFENLRIDFTGSRKGMAEPSQ